MLRRSIESMAAALVLSASCAFAPAYGAPAPAASAAALESARSLAGAGNYRDALALLERYLATDPRDGAAEQYAGDLDVRIGDLKAAERAYGAAIRSMPQDKAAHDRLGDAFASDDLVAQAIAEYQKSLPDVVAYAGLVRLHRRIGDLPAFVAAYARRADGDRLDATAQLGYGVVLRDLHRPQEAAGYLERAVALTPGSCAAQTELGTAYLDLHRSTDAAYQFRQCLAIAPNDYSALVDLSLTYLPGDTAAASALLARAAAAKPDRPEAIVDMGYIADAGGDTPHAIALYQRALAADVLARDAYVDLGYDYAMQRMFSLAEEAYIKGLSVSPSDGRIEYLLGETYSEQGKRELALQQFTAAAHSDEPEISSAASEELAPSH